MNTIFLAMRDKFNKLQKGSEEKFRLLEDKVAECEAQKAIAEAEVEKYKIEKNYADLKLQAYIKESAEEFAILRDELDRTNKSLQESEGQLKTSRGYTSRLEKEKGILEKKLEDVRASIIEEYRNSDQFKEDLADQSFPVYFDGFDDCRAEASRMFPNLDFSKLESSMGTRDELCPDVNEEESKEDEDKEATPDAPLPSSTETANPEKDDQEELTGDSARLKELADQMTEVYQKFGPNFVIEMSQHTGLFIFAFGVGYNKCLSKVRRCFPDVDADFLILTDLDTKELLAEVMKGDPLAYIKVVSSCVDQYGRLTMGSVEDFEKNFEKILKSANKKKSRKRRR